MVNHPVLPVREAGTVDTAVLGRVVPGRGRVLFRGMLVVDI